MAVQKILNTLKLKIADEQKDLQKDFGFACLQGPDYVAIGNVKELQKNVWMDSDGDDVYIPKRMRIQSGTLKIPIGWQGNRGDGKVRLKRLVLWLLGRGGVELTSEGIWLYSPFISEGFKKVTLQQVSEPEYSYLGSYELMTATLVFYVPNPLDNVSYSGGAFV